MAWRPSKVPSAPLTRREALRTRLAKRDAQIRVIASPQHVKAPAAPPQCAKHFDFAVFAANWYWGTGFAVSAANWYWRTGTGAGIGIGRGGTGTGTGPSTGIGTGPLWHWRWLWLWHPRWLWLWRWHWPWRVALAPAAEPCPHWRPFQRQGQRQAQHWARSPEFAHTELDWLRIARARLAATCWCWCW